MILCLLRDEQTMGREGHRRWQRQQLLHLGEPEGRRRAALREEGQREAHRGWIWGWRSEDKIGSGGARKDDAIVGVEQTINAESQGTMRRWIIKDQSNLAVSQLLNNIINSRRKFYYLSIFLRILHNKILLIFSFFIEIVISPSHTLHTWYKVTNLNAYSTNQVQIITKLWYLEFLP